MKEQEKQIEEKAKELKELAKTIRTILEDRVDIKYIPDLDFPIAKEILKHYQPKLSEDSILLSREEYQKDFSNQFNKGYQHGSKETAEKNFNAIIQALEERKERVKEFYGVDETVGVDIAIRTVKELAQQFGVEIKE